MANAKRVNVLRRYQVRMNHDTDKHQKQRESRDRELQLQAKGRGGGALGAASDAQATAGPPFVLER